MWLTACALLALGCDPDADELIEKESTFAESHEGATLYFNVDDDGETELVVKNPSGTIVKSEVEGTLEVRSDGGQPRTIELEARPDRGVLVAELDDLEGVTELEYDLVVEGKKISGSLLVPEEGTVGLVQAEAAIENDPGEAQTKLRRGAHGGVIQIVDERQYEVVTDKKSGETRVYLLDARQERPLKVELSLDVGHAERAELEWSNEGYFVVDLDSPQPPRKVTLIVTDAHEHVHVAVVGYHRHTVFSVHHAPEFWVATHWVHHGKHHRHGKHHHHGHHHGKHHGKHHDVHVDVKHHGEHGKVKVVAHHGGPPKGKVKIQAKTHGGSAKIKLSHK